MEELNTISTTNKYTLDISLWLDDYDDIYSDFDSRNYQKRRISADFIDELGMALKNKNGSINDLVLLLPSEKRDSYTELKIAQSLKSYFNRQLSIYRNRYSRELKKGILLFFIAIALMVINAIISYRLNNNLLSSIIRIILEPSGWFMVWVSFDMLYYDLQRLKKEKAFFNELSALKIYFQSSDLYKIQ